MDLIKRNVPWNWYLLILAELGFVVFKKIMQKNSFIWVTILGDKNKHNILKE